jgi:hypothetical protein
LGFSIGVATFAVQVPLQDQIDVNGYDRAAIQRLIDTDLWTRKILEPPTRPARALRLSANSNATGSPHGFGGRPQALSLISQSHQANLAI